MGKTIRFGIAMDDELLKRFDSLIAGKGYSNRSEAVRDLVRNELVEQEWAADENITVGTVTLVYNHGVRDLSDKLTDIQHRLHEAVISTLHVHLDAHNCMEILVIKGRAKDIKQMADQLTGTKGVKHGRLTMSTSGKDIV